MENTKLMKKTNLIEFIEKYHLAGATTSVKWEASNGTLKTNFISDNQNVIGNVSTNIDLGEHALGVFATPQLLKMLSAVDDDINMSINSVDKTAVNINISDKDVNLTFMLADLSVIARAPELKNVPDWNVKIDITSGFRERFIKSKNALPESENFGVVSKNGVTEIIMNYSTINTNRIKFSTDSTISSDFNVICFSSSLFKEILQANKSATTGTLEISSAGLSRVSFTSPSFTSTYYLVQLQTA